MKKFLLISSVIITLLLTALSSCGAGTDLLPLSEPSGNGDDGDSLPQVPSGGDNDDDAGIIITYTWP